MHSRLERTLKMNRTRFKRRTGIYLRTLADMEAVLIRRYSGKKKRHTLKTQVVINVTTCMIMSVAIDFGSMHDLTLFRHSGVRVHPETALIGDAGYQGIWRHHGYPITPHKGTKVIPLTPEQRQQNRELAATRLGAEHVIRRLKIFRVLNDIYRHRRRRFALRVNLIAAVCNRSIAGVA
ncbi:transposase family protein [Deinococcus arenicola]|uniref:Transposase n=1 Tax=Deinococcus arenicola TaxID=2994950 RepID=A0ABU4DW09_9DEIO|nr:transposase family protein [Deinococcus sp. ZS9-10]MDV6376214.1 transposase [Deinococcus sp. ZS9-10]